MLKKYLCRVGAGFCALALAVSVTAARAASPQPETVHVTFWDGYLISVDGVPIGFTDQQGRDVPRPIIYQGSVYIPLQTASEWLGCDAVWDEEARTVTLTSGKEVYYRNMWLDQTVNESKEEFEQWREQYLSDYKNGMDIQLRPDVTVLLDGEAKTFATVNGTPVYPALLRGEVYLPVRGVGELLGKVVHYQPRRAHDPACSEIERFEQLYEPMPTWGRSCLIQIYDLPTQEELAEVQAYIDQCRALYDKMVGEIAQFRATEDMTREEAIARIEVLRDEAEAIRALPQPQAGFFHKQYDELKVNAWVLRRQLDSEVLTLETPDFITLEAYIAADRLGSKAILDSLVAIRGSLSTAQERLDEELSRLE